MRSGIDVQAKSFNPLPAIKPGDTRQLLIQGLEHYLFQSTPGY